jgi:ABC-type multidrug transport system fused ATPase/permease subunit
MMYRQIIKLVKGRYRAYGLALLICLLVSGLLNGLTIGLIAPLVESTSGLTGGGSKFVRFFHAAFQYFQLSLSLLNILTVALFIAVLNSLLLITKAFLTNEIQIGYEIEQKSMLYKLLGNVKLDKLYQMNFGNIIQVTQQETKMSTYLIDLLVRLLSNLANTLVYLAVVLLVSGKTTLFIGGGLIIYYLIFRRIYTGAKNTGRKMGKINDQLQQTVNIMLYGYKTIKSYLSYNVIIEQQMTGLKDYKEISRRFAVIGAVSVGTFEPLAILIIIMSYIVYQYTVTELLIFVAAIVRFYTNIKEVQNTHYKISYHYPALERVQKLKSSLQDSQYNFNFRKSAPYKFDRAIEATDLCFSYREDSTVLHNITLQIPKGSRIGFVGKSGSGKSTLIDLIMRFFKPDKGTLTMDGIPFESISYEDFISNIGYVSQEPFMLNGTIRENVVLYRDFSRQEVEESLKKANAWDFVNALDDNIDTLIGESGTMISGGEKQRISLARAIIGKPEILILDEATSALDNESEWVVQSTIENLTRDITVIIIAHRLSTVKNVDKLYVLNQGMVAEEGTYHQLESNSVIFKSLLQGGDFLLPAN